MECNKKEAFCAIRMAEKKMENKDFLRARKIAIQAQKLYPELENISQLIMVCDVHCSAENKVHGIEMDWYGILKVEPTADDLLIRKQSRKFGLFLHPDKNKFPGAADAFKLIGEAQSVLLDQGKRWIYDMKCISAAVNEDPKQANGPSKVQQPPGHEKSSVNANRQFQQAPQTAQTGSNCSRPSFYTACPFCSIWCQYNRDVLNKSIKCQTCGKSFIGNDIGTPGVASHNSWSLLAVPNQTVDHNQAPSKVDQLGNAENSTTIKGVDKTWSSEAPQGSKPNERCGDISTNCNQKRKAEIPQPCEKMNEKKRKHVSESSKSCNSEASTKSKEVSVKGGGSSSKPSPPRSTRSKRDVSFTCNINDDINTVVPVVGNTCRDSSQSTRVAVKDLPLQQVPPVMECNKEGAFSAKGIAEKKMENKGLQNTGYETKIESDNKKPSKDAESEPEILEYPDPDFSDFDKDREEKCFAAGQIWAVYDNQDTMPRFYAQIRKVINTSFKLQITWLEPDPDDKDEIKWVEEDLPVLCGNFRQGSSKNTEDRLMFSHVVSWDKGSRRNTYKIYPRKGETWALFKSWDINWSLDPENHRKYQYEFVEILSDYADGTAISVAYLGKVKGYVCLFCRTKQGGVDTFQVGPKEILRFSHRIPSFQITGDEILDSLKGSFELDPVCLPPNLQEIDPPTSQEMKSRKMPPVGPCSTFATDTMETIPNIHVDIPKNQAEQKKLSDPCVDLSTDEEDQKLQSDASFDMFENPAKDAGVVPDFSEDAYEIPDPEFYNFDANKSLEKFEIGQIWAMYCDEDGMPKYYGWIRKIDLLPKYKLHVAWLGVCSTSNDMIQWVDKKIPVTCGRFKLRKMKPSEYTSTAPFSHQVRVRVESRGKKEEYVILPRKGEIWALYKSWNAGMKCSDLEKCDYDIVEVVEECQSGISVLSLEEVKGFKSVFRAQVKEQFPVTFTIPANELLRFSHQIPAFRLTGERGGSLRGYLELDTAAFPFHWFCKD